MCLSQVNLASGGTKELLDLKEVSELTGYAPTTIYGLCHKKLIPHYKVNGRKLCFKRSEIEAWMTKNRVSTLDEQESEAANYVMRNRRNR